MAVFVYTLTFQLSVPNDGATQKVKCLGNLKRLQGFLPTQSYYQIPVLWPNKRLMALSLGSQVLCGLHSQLQKAPFVLGLPKATYIRRD